MADPGIMGAFERLYGKDLADQVRALIAKRERGAIDSVGRQERAQRQPERPPPDPEDQWWNK